MKMNYSERISYLIQKVVHPHTDPDTFIFYVNWGCLKSLFWVRILSRAVILGINIELAFNIPNALDRLYGAQDVLA